MWGGDIEKKRNKPLWKTSYSLHGLSCGRKDIFTGIETTSSLKPQQSLVRKRALVLTTAPWYFKQTLRVQFSLTWPCRVSQAWLALPPEVIATCLILGKRPILQPRSREHKLEGVVSLYKSLQGGFRLLQNLNAVSFPLSTHPETMGDVWWNEVHWGIKHSILPTARFSKWKDYL